MGLLTIEDFENTIILKVNKGLLIKYIKIKECENPFCGCGDFEMLCSNVQTTNPASEIQSFSFEGNIFAEAIAMHKNINLTDVKQHERIYDFLNEHLNSDDWNTIYAVFQVNKARRISKFKVDEFDDYEYVFEEKHFANIKLRVSLNEIFPWRDMFVVEKEGTQYKLEEHYCKSNCDCNCSKLSFFVFKNEDELIDTFDYNYKTSKINKDEYAWVIEQLAENHERLNVLLENRNLKVRYLFIKAVTNSENLALQIKLLTGTDINFQSTKTNQFKNVGRNEKCPCGSGEKFKKCCLKKIEVGS